MSFPQLEWSPNGETILTATTAPRLRIGNGFKVFHYSGSLLHETVWPAGQELLQVVWQKYSDGTFAEKPISSVKVQGIQPSQPQVAAKKYVPPAVRTGASFSSPRSQQNDGGVPPERSAIPGLPIGYKVSQGKMKKERNARRKNNNEDTTTEQSQPNATQQQQQPQSNQQTQQAQANNKPRNRNQRRPKPNQNNHENGDDHGANTENAVAQQSQPTGVADGSNQNGADGNGGEANSTNKEKPKKNRVRDYRRALQKKLRDIEDLKTRRDNGETLKANQITSINSEADVLQKLNSLNVSA